MAPQGQADCIFCRIAQGKLPSRKVDLPIPDLDGDLYAFEDIHPRAPHHVLVIPRRHISTLNDLEPGHEALVGRMVLAAAAVAKARGIAAPGYRLVLNCNEAAGQSVFHIHLHLLGGRPFAWPPG